MEKIKIPKAFLFRRIHSLSGLLVVIFLFEHLITNSQAALWLDEGHGFVKIVNFFQSIPHLYVYEIILIAIPIFFHVIWGIKYTTTSENNAKNTDGTKPSLKYKRNIAYNWQRTTSYVIGIFLIFHVVQMRFVKSPTKVVINGEKHFVVKINDDQNLQKLLSKMKAEVITEKELAYKNLSHIFSKFKLRENERLVMTKQSGQAFLLVIRDTLKSPFMIGLYSIFVLVASFHALNGLWTFLISWGFILSLKSQQISLRICFWLMLFILSLGLISIWSGLIH